MPTMCQQHVDTLPTKLVNCLYITSRLRGRLFVDVIFPKMFLHGPALFLGCWPRLLLQYMHKSYTTLYYYFKPLSGVVVSIARLVSS